LTPRLSEFARSFVYPSGITRTVWPRVEAKGREIGLGFDWWQSQLGTVCLGYGADGKYVATVGGIGFSIPRQVGKTYFVLALIVCMCILFPGMQVVWTAHHLRTSTKTFTALRGICRRKKVAPHIRAMRAANGEQQVEFHNGSMIMFGARSMGFGRGFDEIDFEVYDEAQILDTKALEDMVAATNQARHEHGALLFFMGTPPRPSDPSEAFTARRRKARDGKSPNAIWLEIGADPSSDPDDQSQWPLMNPSYPLRTPPEALERLRENLADDDSWNREGRGVWDEETEGGDLPYGRWLELSDSQARRGDKPVFGLELIGERRVWIAVAWKRDDGSSQVMLTNDGLPLPAHRAVVECQRLRDEWGGMVASAAFRDELEREGVDLLPMTASDFAAGCGLMADSILAGTVQHGNQKALNTAVKAARWRPALTSGERAFLFKDMPEVGPAGAAARALWGLENADPMPAIY
jgi:hypothetical protein